MARDLDTTGMGTEPRDSIFSGMPGYMFRRIRQPAGRYLFEFLSEGADVLFSIARPRLLTEHLDFDWVHRDDRSMFVDVLEDSTETYEPINISVRVIGEDGRTRTVRTISVASKRADGSVAWEGIGLLCAQPPHISDFNLDFDRSSQRSRSLQCRSSASVPVEGAFPDRSTVNRESLLTQREHDVVDLLEQGLTNKEIARRLTISPGTVKVHVASILRNLGYSSRRQLRR